MFWPMFAVALGFLGLAVLAVLAVRVFVEAERLGRQVADSARRIGRAAEDLERAATATARSAEACCSPAVLRTRGSAVRTGVVTAPVTGRGPAGTLLIAARRRGTDRGREYAQGLPDVHPGRYDRCLYRPSDACPTGRTATHPPASVRR